jgi:solute carrier family 25 aspartate/glutamate transporter 12/13
MVSQSSLTALLTSSVPFSAIYFPTYFHLKKDLFGESPTKKLGIMPLLTAGAIAGMPAAYLTTPFDVIKTRLQVEVRKGEQTYTSLRHCARTILAQEGWKAFFKGGPARIMRSSPQFGFTLAGYEYLSRIFPLHGADAPVPAAGGKYLAPGELPQASSPLPYVRSRNALKILLDLDTQFGMPKVQGGTRWESGLAHFNFLGRNGNGNGNGPSNGNGHAIVAEAKAAPEIVNVAAKEGGDARREGFIGKLWWDYTRSR